MENQAIWVFSTASSNYLPRLIQLDSSLRTAKHDLYKIYLSLDDVDFPIEPDRLASAKLVKRSFITDHNPELAKSLSGRSLVEQYFTIAPSFLRHYASLTKPGDWLVYCDSDIKFFAPIDEILMPFQKNSAVIVPHRHHFWNNRRLAKYGTFNVGLVAFRNSPEGMNLLNYWAESCIRWCKDSPEAGKYADQKYLEDFLKLGSNVGIDTRKGANLAPWNSAFHRLQKTDNEGLLIGGEPILYFHMQGLQRSTKAWELGHLPYFSIASVKLKKFIYEPYLQELEAETIRLQLDKTPTTKLRSSGQGLSYHARRILSRIFGQTVHIRELRSNDCDPNK